MSPASAADGAIGVIILAAGESSRMGRPKQLLSVNGKTLLRHAIDAARVIDEAPVVVLGAHAAAICAEVNGLPVTIIENTDWQSGMGGSLRTGLQALLDHSPKTQAAIIMLCDQPRVTGDILRALVEPYRSSASPIVACEYGGVLGVPALFHRTMFQELLALQGAEGARKIIQRYPAQAARVSFPDGAIDLDTPEDFAAVMNWPDTSGRRSARHQTVIP